MLPLRLVVPPLSFIGSGDAECEPVSCQLNNALQNLAQAVSEAGDHMSHTESGVTGMFA